MNIHADIGIEALRRDCRLKQERKQHLTERCKNEARCDGITILRGKLARAVGEALAAENKLHRAEQRAELHGTGEQVQPNQGN